MMAVQKTFSLVPSQKYIQHLVKAEKKQAKRTLTLFLLVNVLSGDRVSQNKTFCKHQLCALKNTEEMIIIGTAEKKD